MLIPYESLYIKSRVKGVIHVGAHECEERDMYIRQMGLTDADIVWVDAIAEKVQLMRERLPNAIIFNECVGNIDNQSVNFMVTNNYQSSSMLNFKTHATEHPHVVEERRIQMNTKTLNTIFRDAGLNPAEYNFMNLDIQGAELMALQGASDILPHIDYIYSEVNETELYENCALLPQMDAFLEAHGFVRVQITMTSHGWGDALYVRKTILH